MQNGHDKQPAPININPQQAAAFAMQFIAEVPHTRAQREAYDIAVALLTAIANGQVQITQAPQPAPLQEGSPKADER